MTGVETFLFIDRRGIILNRGGNFTKIMNQGGHRGPSDRDTWTGCLALYTNRRACRYLVVLIYYTNQGCDVFMNL